MRTFWLEVREGLSPGVLISFALLLLTPAVAYLLWPNDSSSDAIFIGTFFGLFFVCLSTAAFQIFTYCVKHTSGKAKRFTRWMHEPVFWGLSQEEKLEALKKAKVEEARQKLEAQTALEKAEATLIDALQNYYECAGTAPLKAIVKARHTVDVMRGEAS